ncbi:phospholipase C [Silvibacterium bohemicum]|uniref:phospholipase C n=1 Tax=Silvibacterium bohemicum TaxID=1577686 RepID=A0A841JVY8_9BACT|nr:phospholipase C, phosphocholine-specific [Silvibacterium bohemicum]MBB6142608.1 phospholipase C [Silvibacterium bohemicum]
MQTRRDFLKLAAMLSGTAGVSGLVPESIKRAYAIEPAQGSTYLDAEHIVILMQENRSFDHSLGTLQGVRGFNDPRALRLANGNSVFVQTDAAGDSYAPWRLDIRDTRITWMGSVPHSRNSQVDAWNDGHHDGWLEAKRSYNKEYANLPMTMGHYTREDLPFYYSLADAFTVCDQNYCSVMTSTTPNRSFFWTGTVRDEQRADSKVYMRNDEIERGGMKWKTFPERLHEAGIDWKFYQNELTHAGGLTPEENSWLSNYGCNVLEDFAAYNVDAYAGSVSGIQERLASTTHQVERLQHSLSTEQDPQVAAELRVRLQHAQDQIQRLQASLQNSGETRYKQMTDQQRALHHAAFVTNAGDPHYRTLEPLAFEDQGKQQEMMVPKGDIFYQFRKDVNEGKLPAVSWLSGPQKFSDHPSSPWYGAWYVSEIMDILTKNPEVWKKTIFILTYDENDGYFDHAPSFVAADPKRPETGGASEGIDTALEYTYAQDELDQGVSAKEARSGPIGMGFRVPMIVASPWTRGGWVNSQLFDHTSTLMFLEHFVQNKHGKVVKEENISAWRRSVSGDLASNFRPYDTKEKSLDFLDRDKFVVGIQQARYKEIPSNYKKLSSAEIETINKGSIHSEFISHQEKGIRPACALPYELYVDGLLTEDGTTFQLRMTAGAHVHGSRSSGAPFNVYLRKTSSGGEMTVASYAVKAGDTLTREYPLTFFADSRYLIDVHGPNGFYRSFAGDPHTQPLQTRVTYERKGGRLTGNAEVHLRNPGTQPAKIAVEDNSYKAASITKTVAGGHDVSIVIPLEQSHGWYDFTIKTEGSSAETRYAGRVETGRSSFTDPFMGGVV